MSTSDRAKLAAAALALAAWAAAGCGAESGDCVRYSDCDQGLTCADGKCVVPGPSSPSSADGDDGDATDGGDAGAYDPYSYDAGDDEG